MKQILLSLSFLLFIFASFRAQINTVVQTGHNSPVKEITVHHNNRICATTDGFEIKLWDLETGIEIGELSTGYDRVLPLSQIKFVNDSVDLILSFVINNRLVFKEIKSNRLVNMKDIPLKEKTVLSDYDQLKATYLDRNENPKSMKKYEKAVESLNNKYDEEWKKYLSKTVKASNLLSSNEHAIFYTKIDRMGGKRKAFNRRYKAYKPIRKKYGKTPTETIDSREFQLFKLHQKKWKRKNFRTVLYKESFKGKKKELLSIPISYASSNVKYKSIWTNENETYAVIGKSLLYIQPVDKKQEKKTRRLIGLFPDDDLWSFMGVSPNEQTFLRARIVEGQTLVELYDLSKSPKSYTKKKQVLADTTLHLPLLKTLLIDRTKSIELTNEFVVVLYDDGQIDGIKWMDDSSIQSAFYEDTYGMEPFTHIDAIYFNPNDNQLYLTGSTSKYQNICFRAFSMTNSNYSWSYGSEFPSARLKVIDYSKDALVTSVNLRGSNLKSVSISQLPKDNLSPIGYASLNLNDLTNEVVQMDESWVYSPNRDYYFRKDTAGYILWSDAKAQKEKRVHRVSDRYILKWNPTSNLAIGYQDSLLYAIDGKNGNLLDSLKWSSIVSDVITDTQSNEVVFLDKKNQLVSWNYPGASQEPAGTEVLMKLKKPTEPLSSVLKQAQLFSNEIAKVNNQLDSAYSGLPVLPAMPANLGSLPSVGILGKRKTSMFYNPAGLTVLQRKPMVRPKMQTTTAKPTTKDQVQLYFKRQMPTRIEVSPNGKYLLYFPDNGFEFRLIDLENKEAKPLEKAAPTQFYFEQSSLKAVEDLFISDDGSGFDIANSIRNTRLEKALLNYTAIDSSWNRFVYPKTLRKGKAKYAIRNMQTGETEKIKVKSPGKLKPFISESGRYLALSSSEDYVNTIRIFDLKDEPKQIKKIVGHGGAVYFSPTDEYVFSCGNDNQLKVWELSSEMRVVDTPVFSYIVSAGAEDGVIYDAKGYYMTKNSSMNTLAFNYDGNTYPLEQFDLLKNRPDSILRNINKLSKRELSKTSYPIFKKLADYRTSAVSAHSVQSNSVPTNLPEVAVSGHTTYNGTSDNVNIQYLLKNGTTGKIIKLEIFNNNIPWKTLDFPSTNQPSGAIEIPLVLGANNLKFTATSDNGYKSISKYAFLRRKSDKDIENNKTTHLILVGINEYPSELTSLSKPLEDCGRFKRLFEQHANVPSKDKLIVHELYNQDVTKEAFTQVVNELNSISIHDEVVLVLAGHGELSSEFQFVLPKSTSNKKELDYLTYTEIISQMQKIPAARKLLMIDACHSGLTLSDNSFRAQEIELYFKVFFNYSLPTGIQVISSAYGLEEAEDGYFAAAFEAVLADAKGSLTLEELFQNLKAFNTSDKNANQKISLTNVNSQLDWPLFEVKE